ncbi:MAG: DUF3857 domain-containing protein [Myxococcota bacterium]
MKRPAVPRSPFLPALALALTLPGPGAGGQAGRPNPYDALQGELSRSAATERGPAGDLALLDLWANVDDASPDATRAGLDAVVASRRASSARRAYAEALRARQAIRDGDLEGARERTERLGYVTAWQIVGPFDDEGTRGFARAFGPEAAPATSALAPDERYPGKEREVSWRPAQALGPLGYVDFDGMLRPRTAVCGYAATTVASERAQALTLFVGGSATKVFWNGEPVLEDDVYRHPDPDRHAVVVGAHAGANRLLVKVCAQEDTWGFFLRIRDARDRAPRGVRVMAEDLGAATAEGHGPGRLPRTSETLLARFEAAAEDDDPEALHQLAQLLLHTGADDPAEERARQLATQAAEAEPTPARAMLAARLQEQRHEVQRFVELAASLAPDDPEVILLQAQLARSGLHPEDAVPLLARLLGPLGSNTPPPLTRERPTLVLQAALLRAELLQDFDLPEAAFALVARWAPPTSPGWARAYAEYARAAGRRDSALAARERAVALRHDDFGSRRALIADAVHRNEPGRATPHLEVLADLGKDRHRNLRYVAGIYEALGQTDRAMEVFAEARRIAPDDAGTLVAQAGLLLRLQQPEPAAETLRAALALRPQDAETRELLEQIQPRERADEAYAAEAETLLARRREDAGFPTTVLQDLTVNTVYGNGLGSSFHQLATQIHDEEGARSNRTHSIAYDPGSQRVDIRLARVHRADGSRLEATQLFEQPLGEPWYRIYYDTRAAVVVFPDLEPGDVVELRWRVDDVAHRNLFADYYGDLRFLQGFAPRAHVEYVLLAPESRELFFGTPELPGLERTEEVREGQRITRYVAEDVPALRDEPSMPGMTELAPYLHVSTYATWSEVGAWWWGLVQDQLAMDQGLARTTRELVRGKTTTREKVVAIHDWVVANTRYVGLEFGIHGYKPYRVRQIVERGFGDCKDKASLLYVMFREAGIDAHLVLVRTRRNGRIETEPASLAVFDHAIAYVPELDLYIDGTAEHSGITELPEMDQGVTVLHVWPEGSELRRTPVLPPEGNRRAQRLTIRVRPDGSGSVEATETHAGTRAPRYRATYQAEGTQAERLERALRAVFPGLRLERHEFGRLDSLELPVNLEWSGEAPQVALRDGEALQLAPSATGELTRVFATQPERAEILDLGGTFVDVEDRTVVVPRGLRVRETPSAGVAESAYGRLSLEVEVQGGDQVRMRTELVLAQDRIAPEDYAAFRAWVTEADRILRQRLTLEVVR